MASCIFCMIAKKAVTSECLYEDDKVMAFKDVNPQAPVHFLVIPKEHYETLNEINEKNSDIIARCFEVIAKLVKKEGIEDGYRVLSNNGDNAGQTVRHLHFHVLGGKHLGEQFV
jgi:histidine triad (HIT) family protein